jgi:threonine/homoserine/homoserine lactone efflux protein
VRTSWWRAARQGFVVGFANPKALIMFGTVPAWVLAASRART